MDRKIWLESLSEEEKQSLIDTMYHSIDALLKGNMMRLNELAIQHGYCNNGVHDGGERQGVCDHNRVRYSRGI